MIAEGLHDLDDEGEGDHHQHPFLLHYVLLNVKVSQLRLRQALEGVQAVVAILHCIHLSELGGTHLGHKRQIL